MRGVRTDFGQMYPSKVCPLKGECKHLDTLPAMLTCEVLRSKASHLLDTVQVKYSDVFSLSLNEQKKVTLVYSELLNIRDEILSPPAAE